MARGILDEKRQQIAMSMSMSTMMEISALAASLFRPLDLPLLLMLGQARKPRLPNTP